MKPSPSENQPALFGDQHSCKHYAACWSADARQFADSLIAEWNKTFGAAGHGYRANHTRHNHSSAVELYRWLHSPANDGECMTEEDVRIAIRLYAEDPYNIKHCHGQFRSFGDWVREAADKQVDRQLARVGRHRGAVAMTSNQTTARTEAERLLAAKPWCLGDAARRATGANLSLRDFIRDTLADLDARPRVSGAAALRVWLLRLAALRDKWDDLAMDNATRLTFSVRASELFTALQSRAPTRQLADSNLWAALTLALFASEKGKEPEDAGP